jgi:hypothetical protein
MNLGITNVISVSVSTPPSGASDYQVNNLAIFTKETPVNVAITATAPGVYVSPAAVLADWGAGSEAYTMANLIFSQSPNILSGGGQLFIFPMAALDTLDVVIPTAAAQFSFFGALWAGYAPLDAEVIATSTALEPLRIKLFASSNSTAALTPTTGLFAIISGNEATHTRMILYTVSATSARLVAAAYAGRAMSVDFAGSSTTSTMHLKSLTGVSADPGMTQAYLNTCKTLGVDVYATIAGVPAVFSTGGNEFFDNVYNLDWFVFALQTAGFNALRQTGTKLPQTEQGVAVLRGAYLNVLRQAVINGYVAPGSWNSSELFGDPDDLRRNILDAGFYIYSQPVNQQAQSDRAARKAPLIQIAIKLAGAIHSSSVVVSINV